MLVPRRRSRLDCRCPLRTAERPLRKTPILVLDDDALHPQALERLKFDAIIGKSARLARTLALVEKVADTDSTVLITGESGTGKELFARALHDNGRRAERPFVAVNCGAIPEALLESELFGHVKGAFTGAHASRDGRFAAAHGGTIFLDEIGDMSPALQVKLLRVLQERCFEPVGSSTPRRVDVRVIAATHRSLPEQIAEGRFREDLYDRLAVVPIEVPALRERIEDLPLLVHHFLDRARHERGSQVTGVSDEALQRLMDYDWPGNVRELENLIERLTVVVGVGEIDAPDLPDPIRAEPALRTWAPRLPSSGLDFNDVVTRFENDLIEQALERTGWNKNRAAQLLRLNRTTLLEKIKKRGLAPRGPLL
ncbi:MAG: sigma-54 dependent transcriptional regulator [Myxococcota bacterium]